MFNKRGEEGTGSSQIVSTRLIVTILAVVLGLLFLGFVVVKLWTRLQP